ncbi:methyltransferase, FkbM family [Methylococcus capsulatus str. Bath]|uniref:Methyltransferase, FkbM family n=1 Tax=Methylococcus capsulatus (strain ATCC 33009 / NCIMB 11132 / Bath) TaxID=243233 RepID=Q609S3_METCA|nr:FkbM family methyltransferase [Methylococcus capsulatus]AAU92796.1 methyltransferase, FkbM family [Methylococcus capsulatus str. Bath]
MKEDLLHRLRQRAALASRSRLDRALHLRWRLVAPYVLRHAGILRKELATTFFDRRMRVVLPEPVSVTIWRYGMFEPDVAFYLLSLLRPGDNFVDIGGHFGFFSMLGRELVGAEGTVVTFEPMPATREILAENMQRNAAPARHHLVPAAAGALAGTLMFKDFGLAGSAFATPIFSAERASGLRLAGEVEVEVRTIDSVVDEFALASLRLMKIDAENAEYEVIQGALSTIRRLRPGIVIEAGDSAGSSTRRVLDALVAEDYRPFEFHDWALRPHVIADAYGYLNLLMLPAESSSEIISQRCCG